MKKALIRILHDESFIANFMLSACKYDITFYIYLAQNCYGFQCQNFIGHVKWIFLSKFTLRNINLCFKGAQYALIKKKTKKEFNTEIIFFCTISYNYNHHFIHQFFPFAISNFWCSNSSFLVKAEIWNGSFFHCWTGRGRSPSLVS